MSLVLLDAKSAFDVVIHSHLIRRVYHAGIQDKHWSLINSMHQKASSSVKLADNMTVNVEENIKKSRRSAYGLFGGGFHGNYGLDPETTR
jgi:hypothetical protein